MSKILFQSPAGGVLNGADMATKWQMKYLVEQGFEVGYIYSDKRGMTDVFKQFLSDYQINNYFLEYNWWMNQALDVPDFQAISEIVKIIDEHQYDVAITATANIPHLAVAAALTHIKHIWLIHEYPEGEFAYTKDKYDMINQLSNQILTPNQDLSLKIGELIADKDKVSYFYPFSDANAQVIQKSQSPSRLINVNAFSEGKNSLELIKIFQKLQKQFPDLQLIFTGKSNNDYGKLCQQYVEKYDIKNVKFLNDFTKNWSAVQENDIFVNPSKMETFGLTLVEALKFGIVTIAATNQQTGNEMEKLGYLDAHHLYQNGDIDDAVGKITAILTEFGKYKTDAIEMAKRVIDEQSLEVITKNLKLAVEQNQENPSKFLRHLHRMFLTSGVALEERLTVMNQQKNLIDERLTIIEDQKVILDEHLAMIENQKAMLDEQKRVMDERMSIIDEQKNELETYKRLINDQNHILKRIRGTLIGRIIFRGKL